jgi:hypothetical protein
VLYWKEGYASFTVLGEKIDCSAIRYPRMLRPVCYSNPGLRADETRYWMAAGATTPSTLTKRRKELGTEAIRRRAASTRSHHGRSSPVGTGITSPCSTPALRPGPRRLATAPRAGRRWLHGAHCHDLRRGPTTSSPTPMVMTVDNRRKWGTDAFLDHLFAVSSRSVAGARRWSLPSPTSASRWSATRSKRSRSSINLCFLLVLFVCWRKTSFSFRVKLWYFQVPSN